MATWYESLLPDTIPLTDEQFKTFLEKTVTTEQSRRLLDGLTAQNAATAAPQGAKTPAQGNGAPVPKTADTAQGRRTDEGENSRNGARESG